MSGGDIGWRHRRVVSPAPPSDRFRRSAAIRQPVRKQVALLCQRQQDGTDIVPSRQDLWQPGAGQRPGAALSKGVYDPEQMAALKTRFAALMAPTGPLRDLDVYLLEQQGFYDLVPEQMHVGLDRMFARLRDRRKVQQTELSAHLRSKAYRKKIKALTRLFARRRKLLPGPNASRASFDLACELIWKRYRRIRRIATELTAGTTRSCAPPMG